MRNIIAAIALFTLAGCAPSVPLTCHDGLFFCGDQQMHRSEVYAGCEQEAFCRADGTAACLSTGPDGIPHVGRLMCTNGTISQVD